MRENQPMNTPPDGFTLDEPKQHYGEADSWYQLVGPLYHGEDNPPGTVRLCFYSERRYISSMNRVHGGMLSSFMDYVLFGTAASVWKGTSLATVSLNINFVSACPPDVWVIGTGEIVRAGKTMVFVNGEARADGRVIVHASGTFRGH